MPIQFDTSTPEGRKAAQDYFNKERRKPTGAAAGYREKGRQDRATGKAGAKHKAEQAEREESAKAGRREREEAAKTTGQINRESFRTTEFEQRELFRRSQQRLAARRRAMGPMVGTSEPVASVSQASASVGITGALFRMGAMALGLIVVYAVVTHAGPTSGAIGNTGAILQKFTASKPLFTKVG